MTDPIRVAAQALLDAYDRVPTVVQLIAGLEGLRAALSAPQPAAADERVAEPVHWRAVLDEAQRPQQPNTRLHDVGFINRRSAESWIAEQLTFKGWTYTLEPLYSPAALAAVESSARALLAAGREDAEHAAMWRLHCDLYEKTTGVDAAAAIRYTRVKAAQKGTP